MFILALGRVFSEYFGSPTNVYSTNFSTITITYNSGLAQEASSGRSAQSSTAQIKKKTGTVR
jgi:hypothetical protein